jgi:carboxyl-terminal processing protease
VRRFLLQALSAPLLLLLAACAAQPDTPMGEERAADAISATLRNIEDIYYRETEASALAAAGLAQIAQSYPRIRFRNDDGMFTVSVDNKPVSTFIAPADRAEPNVWGERIAHALDLAARNESSGGPTLNDLTDEFLRGTLRNLDTGSSYISPEEFELRSSPPQAGGTLNLILRPQGQDWVVERVFGFEQDNLAQIKRDDVVHSIDGTPLKGVTEAELLALYRGTAGSRATLEIERQGTAETLTVALHRERRDAPGVRIEPDGAVLRIAFSTIDQESLNAAQEVILAQVASPAPRYAGVILDLRNSPGGEIKAAIALADLFVSQGRIFSTLGRHADAEQHFRASSRRTAYTRPLVVLVDANTGSGAEFTVAGLADAGRAVVVGEATFGAGRIQTFLPLPNGGRLKLSWVEVITPAGYRLDKRGVMPTVCTGGDVTAEAVIAALRNGTGGIIDKATRTRNIDPDDTAAVEAFRALCPPRGDDADVSLEVAQALLADSVLFARILEASSR